MIVELADCTSTLLAEIGNRKMTRSDVAVTYRLALRSSSPTDWAAVNRAIVERWSSSALKHIKRLAWRSVGGVVEVDESDEAKR